MALTQAHPRPGPPAHNLVPAGGPALGPRRRRRLATRRQKVVAAVIVVGAFSFLLFRGLTNALNYYLTANQAVAQRASLGSSDFRIQGTVLPGLRDSDGKLYFTIASHHVDVRVVSTGSPSQLFRAGIPVVLDGHWQGDVFSSFQIMVQHGSTYTAAQPRAKAPAPPSARQPR